MLNVLQVTGIMNRGGAEIMLMDIMRHLPHDVHFDFLVQTAGSGTIHKGDFDDEIYALGGRLFYIQPQWKNCGYGYVSVLKRLIKNEIGLPNVVHSHINRNSGLIALAASQCGVKKIIAHMHGAWKPQCHSLASFAHILMYKYQRRLISRFATDRWACSPIAARALFYPGESYQVINNAISDSFLECTSSTSLKIRNDWNIDAEIILGNVGRITRDKYSGFPLEILSILHSHGLKVGYVQAGRCDDKDYKAEIDKEIEKNDLNSFCCLLGDYPDVPDLLGAIDIFVAPSKNEGFGMSVVEAQATGLPCVVSTGHPKTVDMGLGLVRFVDGYDPNKWADAVLAMKGKRLYDKENIRATFKKRGFDAEENTKKIIELYRS